MFDRNFPDEEYTDRWARLHAEMDTRDIEVAVILARGGGTCSQRSSLLADRSPGVPLEQQSVVFAKRPLTPFDLSKFT